MQNMSSGIPCFELLWLPYNKQHQFYIQNPYKTVVKIYRNHAQGLNGVAIKIKSRKHRQEKEDKIKPFNYQQ